MPSFYKVAERAQIARSSLYRKQNFRQMAENACEGRGIGGCPVCERDRFVQENENLRREVRVLRRKIQVMCDACMPAIGEVRSSVVEYCLIDFP